MINSQFFKSYLIARYTFKEMLKGKILWNVAVFGFFIALLTYVATELTFGAPARVAIDLGLSSLSLSSYFISLFVGINLIRKEEESRTIYLIISRPVTRVSFLVGKILGVTSFLALNLLILSLLSLSVVLLIGGFITPLALWAMFFTMLESVLLLCVVVTLSLISNQAISLMGAILLLVVGHAVSETANYQYVVMRPWLKSVINLYHLVLPGFYKFNLKDLVIYQGSFSLEQIMRVILYWAFYSIGLISVASIIIKKKNLD
jgi:ABC-2 type transport system permease protein